MRLFKLAAIVGASALFIVACTSQPATNQIATTNNQPAPAASAAPPADQLAEARKMFAQGGVCARCHSETGEGGEFEVDGKKHLVDPNHIRAAYLDNLEKFRAELKQGCHRHQIDLVPMVTDQPYAEALAQYLTLRMRR